MLEEKEVKATGDKISTYGYNDFNQLIEVVNSQGITTFTYYPTELRESKINGSEVTKYYYDGQNDILEEVNNTQLLRNIFGVAGPVIRENIDTSGNMNSYYYVYNGHGDVAAVIDENRNIICDYEYDIYGEALNPDEITIDNPFRYAGQYFDKETGLYYLRARYYNSELMRFISEDTNKVDVKDLLSLNLYSYCLGNPISLVDVDGHAPEGIWALNRTAGGGGGVLLYTLYNWLVQASPYIQYTSQNVGNLSNAANAVKDKVGSGSSGNQDPNKWDKVNETAKTGTKFGKNGTLVENPGIKVDWGQYSKHGFQRMIERNVTSDQINAWVKTGKALQQAKDKFFFITREGAAVLDKGRLVTVIPKCDYDAAMDAIVKVLFGN